MYIYIYCELLGFGLSTLWYGIRVRQAATQWQRGADWPTMKQCNQDDRVGDASFQKPWHYNCSVVP